MTLKASVGAACAAILCAAGPAHAQSAGGTGTSTTGAGRTTATAPDNASSGGKGSLPSKARCRRTLRPTSRAAL